MAVTAYPFTAAAVGFAAGTTIWKASGGSPIKVALMGAGYTPNQDTQDFWDDISANEVTGDGYTAGGATLTLSDPSVDTGTNQVRLDAADVTWSASTITASYAVIYHATGTPSTSRLLAYVNFGESKSSVAGDFTITWDATGIIILTAATPS